MRKILPAAITAVTLFSAGYAAAQTADPHAGHGATPQAATAPAGVRTAPVDGSMSSTAPTVFTVTFPRAMRLTALTLATDGGRPAPITVRDVAAAMTVTTPLPALGKGNHVINWSAQDAAGRRINGATRFMVH